MGRLSTTECTYLPTYLSSKALCGRACFFANHLHPPATDVYLQPDASLQQALLTTTSVTHGDRSLKTETHKYVNV